MLPKPIAEVAKHHTWLEKVRPDHIQLRPYDMSGIFLVDFITKLHITTLHTTLDKSIRHHRKRNMDEVPARALRLKNWREDKERENKKKEDEEKQKGKDGNNNTDKKTPD
jgi:hypothetical protein